MKSDLSMSLHAELNKSVHNREKIKPRSKIPFPQQMGKEKNKTAFPSNEIQEAIQRLLQNALNAKSESIEIAPITASFQLMDNAKIEENISIRSIAATQQIEALFDKMVDYISHCVESDIKKTTITLNASEFSNSLFRGAKITITEYSSAPKIFNIELAGSPEALVLFQASATDLMAAFQKGNFNFQVNRCEADFSEERIFSKGKVTPIEKEKDQDL